MLKRGVGADDTVLKGLGYCSFGNGSNASLVDVRDGKILRTRPFDVTAAYSPEWLNMWELNVAGHTFKAPTRAYISPLSVSYKKRAYSKNRILYPLKRVDWDPNGDRHPETRGKSKFVRISWDEALDIIASEIRRQYDTYGVGSILDQQDGHGETKCIHGPHGCQTRLLDILGGCTIQARQPDSWEGWYWGAKHVWGQGRGRQALMEHVDGTRKNSMKQFLREREVEISYFTKPVELTEEGLVIERDGRRETVGCDAVVVAVGYHPVNGLADELADLGDSLVVVGDALKCDNAMVAGEQGFRAGYHA